MNNRNNSFSGFNEHEGSDGEFSPLQKGIYHVKRSSRAVENDYITEPALQKLISNKLDKHKTLVPIKDYESQHDNSDL